MNENRAKEACWACTNGDLWSLPTPHPVGYRHEFMHVSATILTITLRGGSSSRDIYTVMDWPCSTAICNRQTDKIIIIHTGL